MAPPYPSRVSIDLPGEVSPGPSPTGIYVQVGCGGAGVDYLATVASYPEPDAKIRSKRFEVSLPCALLL